MYVTRETAYVATPRTASRSTADWLRDRFDAASVGHHHEVRLSPGETRMIWTIVRDPYDRLASIWRYESKARVPFAHWARIFATTKWRGPGPLDVWRPQDEFLRRAPRLDAVFLFEDLPYALISLPGATRDDVAAFPHLTEGDPPRRRDWTEIIRTPEDLDLANGLISDGELALGPYVRFHVHPGAPA